MRPTRRAVLLFACGIPLALLVVVYDAGLWALSFDFSVLVLIAIASDALRSFPSRLLDVKVTSPDRLFIGEQGAIAIAIGATRYRRGVRFQLLAEHQGDLDPPELVEVEVAPGQGARATLPLVPRRRGKVH